MWASLGLQPPGGTWPAGLPPAAALTCSSFLRLVSADTHVFLVRLGAPQRGGAAGSSLQPHGGAQGDFLFEAGFWFCAVNWIGCQGKRVSKRKRKSFVPKGCFSAFFSCPNLPLLAGTPVIQCPPGLFSLPGISTTDKRSTQRRGLSVCLQGPGAEKETEEEVTPFLGAG